MRRLCTLLILCLLLAPLTAGAEDVRVITEFNPPFNFEGAGGPAGIATDLFLLMAERAGLDIKRPDIKVWPWARGYRELLEKPDVILFTTARTPERESLFRWIGPIMPVHSGLIALKSRHIKVKNPVEAAWKYRVGTMRSSASEEELIRLGVPHSRLEPVHDRALNIRKLISGHIDILAGNESATVHTIRQMGLKPDDFELVYRLITANLYYAASPEMDPDLVHKLQSALDDLKAEGALDRIVKQYQ